MSKANESLTTSACPVRDRRAFLLQGLTAGAAVTVGNAELPALTTTAEPSELFLRYLMARAEFLAIFNPGVPGYADETDEWKELEQRTSTALAEAVMTISARSPTTPGDLVELAEVARVENQDVKWGCQYTDGTYDFESKLARGILRLFAGGTHA